MNNHFADAYRPELILMLKDYMIGHTQSLDHEINLAAFCTELMMKAKWK